MSGRTCAGPRSRRRFLKLSSAIALGAALRPSSLFADTASVLVERAAFTMGSIVTIKVYAENVPLAESAIREAFEIMKAVDAGMSVYAPSSGLCGLNRHGHGRAVACSADLIGLLAACADYNRSTHGAFDVTIEPLMELYGFRSDGGAGRYPSDRQIAGCLDGVGMKNVLIDRSARTVSLAHPGTRIDLGGIAVGFALDRAAALLRSRGIMCALINHSGDLIAIGAPPGDRGWEIGITDPVRPERIIATEWIRDEALSTSGNYRNFRTFGGRTIGHILDPASGRTARAVLSSTVIAERATAADALSTGTFVLGDARSEGVLRAHGAGMIVVSHDPADPVQSTRRSMRRMEYRQR